jgi:GMP synthase-like glutamine amidotransferase
MPPILVLQHAPSETLGSLEQHFREAGLVWHTFELFREVPRSVRLDRAAGLVVLGGPMNVDETDRYPFLGPEVAWIRQAIDIGTPLLGICLGAQLLAKALGARVYPNGVKEIGWFEIELTPNANDDPLLGGLDRRQTVFQWHGDTFDLPQGALLLATSQRCRHQAFRFGRRAFGLQFHIEMTPALIASWLEDLANQGEPDAADRADPERIRAATPRMLPPMEAFGRAVLGRFAAMCR